MARPDKVAKVDEVSEQLTNAGATLLTHYRGLSVSEIGELRRALRDANAQMHVVKNTLVRRAADKAGIDGLDEMLVGPTALIFCEEDPVGAAKALKTFAVDHPGLVVRGGYFDGAVLDETEAIRFADLESREDLLSKLVGLMHGALANTARLLQAPIEQQARLLQALVDAGGAPGAPDDDVTADAASSESAEAPVSEMAAEVESSDDASAADKANSPEADGDDGAAEATDTEDESSDDAVKSD
ncbi:MAG: 50S ribosomal protein L10 [Nitriliruptoraceae bacterium]